MNRALSREEIPRLGQNQLVLIYQVPMPRTLGMDHWLSKDTSRAFGSAGALPIDVDDFVAEEAPQAQPLHASSTREAQQVQYQTLRDHRIS